MLQLITSLLMLHSVPGAVPADQLAPAIIWAAERHGIAPVLLTQIVLVESGGRAAAYNAATEDHGLVQINERTLQAYGISLVRRAVAVQLGPSSTHTGGYVADYRCQTVRL